MKSLICGVLFFFFLTACAKQNIPAEIDQVQKEKENISEAVVSEEKADSILNPLSTYLMIDAGLAKAAGDYQEAIQLYEESIKADSTNDAAYFELANIYMELEEPAVKKALRLIKTAKDIDPGNSWYATFYGRLLIDNEYYDEGVKVFEELVKENPKNIDYQYDLAYSYEQAKNYDKAIQMYNSLEQTYGFDPSINYFKHKVYFAQGEFDKGIQEIEEIIDENPEYISYSAYLAEYFYENGDFEKSLKYVNSILGQFPDDPKANEIKAKISASREMTTDVQASLKMIITNESFDLDDKIKMLVPYIDTAIEQPELTDQIISAAEQLAEQYPEEAKVYALLGDFYSNTSNNELAITAYKNSLQFDQSVYSVWEQLILLQSAQNDYENLEEISAQAQLHFPEEFLPHYMNGFSNYQLGKAEQSAKSLENALKFARQQPYVLVEIYSLLGDAYHTLGRFDESNTNFDKALSKDPDNSYVLNNYSYYLATREENLDKATKMAKRALELNPDDANTMDTYGWVLFQKGEYEQSLELLKNAYQLDDDSATILEHLGDAYYKNGKKEEAVEYWLKAQSINPDSRLLNKKISKKKFYPNK